MAKSKQKKSEEVQNLTAALKGAKGVVFADFTGLVVKEAEQLRRELRKAGVTFQVVKKTLLKRVLEAVGLTDVSVDGMKGSVSVAASASDEVEPAKQLAVFLKGHEKLQLLGGVLEQQFVDAGRVAEIAKLPGKQELRARLVGSLASPMRGLASVLQGNLRGLVQVLRAASERK